MTFPTKDDPKALVYLTEGRDLLQKTRDRAKAIDKFKKALKLPITKELRLILLNIMSECANDLDDGVQAIEFAEKLVETQLDFNNAYQLMKLYNKTNSMEKKRGFAQKLKEIETDSLDNQRIIITWLGQCEDWNGVLVKGGEYIEKHGDITDKDENDNKNTNLLFIYKTMINALEKQNRVQNQFQLLDSLIQKGYEGDIYTELSGAHNAIYDLEKAMEYYQMHLRASVNDEGQRKIALSSILVNGVYSGLVPDDEYIGYMRELYGLNKPARENKNFTINTGYFRKIRVGIVSYDFRNHSVGRFLSSMYKEIPQNTGIEIYSYYTCPDRDDEYTQMFRQQSDVFKSVGKYSDSQLRKEFLSDRLDILIETGGMSFGNKVALISERFAPLQLQWLGLATSSFAHNYDYILGDKYVFPEDGSLDRLYVEKPLRMEPCFMVYLSEIVADSALEPPYVRNGYITFGNLSNPKKMSARSIKQWQMVLDAVPGSRLLLRFSTERDGYFMERFNARLARLGLDVSRVSYSDKREWGGYFDTYNDIDILLDTTPFSAWTTMVESFFMGVPTISFKSSHFCGRGYTLLANIGLEEFAADTDEEFVKKARVLANDVERLKDLRKNLKGTLATAPLFDTVAYRKGFENAMREIYVRYCREHKEPFNISSYDGNMDGLVLDCMRADRVIEYLIKIKEPFECIWQLAEEYLEMMKATCEHLTHLYGDQENALNIVSRMVSMLSRLGDAESDIEILAMVRSANLLLAKFI